MLFLEVALVLTCLALLWRPTVSRRIAGAILIVLAGISASAGFVVRSSGDVGPLTELPATFDTTAITLPDGRRFALTQGLQRLQRYAADGGFELGWFVGAPAILASGGLSLGLTTDDRIVVASKQTLQVEVFDVDGLLERRAPYHRLGPGHSVPPIMLPGNFAVEGVALVNPVRAGNPALGWLTLLPALFLHKVTTGMLFGCGLHLLLAPRRRPAAKPFPTTQWRAYVETPHDQQDQAI